MLQFVSTGANMHVYDACNNGGHFSKLLSLKKIITFQFTT